MAIGKKLRFEVFKRDGFCCQYCGRTPPTITLEADHVQAESKGGETTLANLITSCFDCNRGKGANDLEALPASILSKMEMMRERQDQMEAYDKLLIEIRGLREARTSAISEMYMEATDPQGQYVISDDARLSIAKFLELLPFSEVEDAMQVALAALNSRRITQPFKYFCGVCWRKIKQDRPWTGVDRG